VIRLAVEASIRATAFANLGSLYRGQHDYQKAQENFAAALQINPDLPIALVGSGLVAEKQWNYPRAAEYFTRAMRVAPTSVGYMLLSDALRHEGKTGEADWAYEQARKLSTNLQGDQQVAGQLAAE
jgi:tetratricopeptide (TPR) repeat protein